jgi:hypothetical protein
VDEHDGEEVSSLMKAAQEALGKEDAARFQGLFAKDFASTGRTIYKSLLKRKQTRGSNVFALLMAAPQVKRATPSVRVRRVFLELWFDLRALTGGKKKIFHTTWRLRRGGESGSEWKLEHLRTDTSTLAYGSLHADLSSMQSHDLTVLNMKWAEATSPDALVADCLRAFEAKDMEALKARCIDGVLFHALKTGVKMPSVDNGPQSGEHNRNQSLAHLQKQAENIAQFSGQLGVKPVELAPHFTAYSIVAVPQYCTKLKLTTEFDGSGMARSVERVGVSWAGVRFYGKWLIDTLAIESIKR